MKKLIKYFGLAAMFSNALLCANDGGVEGIDEQLTSSVNCRIDLNQDGVNDVAIFLQNLNKQGGKLVVLLSNGKGYNAVELMTVNHPSNLYCRYGATLMETTAANLAGRRYETAGTYVLLQQLETAAFAFFWKKGELIVVQVSD